MRVLFVHNYYQHRGGEDAIFEEEVKLLQNNGYIVETINFTNEKFKKSILHNVPGAFTSLYNHESAFKVKQAIISFKPDIIHIHNLFYTASPSIIHIAKDLGIPIVITLHNYRLVCNSGMLSREDKVPCEQCLTKKIPFAGIKYKCFRNSRIQSIQLTAITSLHKFIGTWQSVNKYIVLTDFAREKILQSSLNLKPEQIVVKPNYVHNLGYVEPVSRKDFFLYVGRLHYEKGIESLIKAAYLHDLPIEIIGDGPFKPLVERAAQDLPHLIYHGYLSREKCIERMKQSKAIIVPSICYEGLPTTILEAFATGTPILCSNQSNLNSIIKNKVNGLLFETNNPISIAETMKELSYAECVKYSKEGIKEFNSRYRQKVVLEQLESIYQSLVESK